MTDKLSTDFTSNFSTDENSSSNERSGNGKIIQINQDMIRKELGDLVKGTVEETLNHLLDEEADRLCGAKRYERSEERKDYRCGKRERKLQTKAGTVTLQVPKLRSLPFESAIIERYRRRECSVEEALIEMYLAGVSVRRVEDITEALWGEKVSPSTVSKLNQKERGLKPPQLVTSDKCLGLVEALAEVFPEADWQRCTVHWYRNILKDVPKSKTKEVAAMLKAIHAQEDRAAADEKVIAVVAKLKAMKLGKASEHVRDSAAETLAYMKYPRSHWRKIRTNNPLERVIREVRRRTRVVGNFPDGKSALMLVAARLRHVAGTKWGLKRYLKFETEEERKEEKQGDNAAASTLAG